MVSWWALATEFPYTSGTANFPVVFPSLHLDPDLVGTPKINVHPPAIGQSDDD